MTTNWIIVYFVIHAYCFCHHCMFWGSNSEKFASQRVCDSMLPQAGKLRLRKERRPWIGRHGAITGHTGESQANDCAISVLASMLYIDTVGASWKVLIFKLTSQVDWPLHSCQLQTWISHPLSPDGSVRSRTRDERARGEHYKQKKCEDFQALFVKKNWSQIDQSVPELGSWVLVRAGTWQLWLDRWLTSLFAGLTD